MNFNFLIALPSFDLVIYFIVFLGLVISALVSVKIEKIREDDPKKSVGKQLVVNFIITFIIALITFFLNNEQSKQFTRMENVGIQTRDTSIKSLDTIEATKALAQEIKQLQDINNGIVQNIEKLSTASGYILKNIKTTTKEHSEENALSGQLDLGYSKPFSDNDLLQISFGGYTMGNTFSQVKKWKPHLFAFADNRSVDPIKFSVVDNKLVVTLKAFDIYGNWIVEIENNNWHRNPNYTGKFNYDNRGFEIVDNKDNISLNLDLLSNNKIKMQGYIPVKEVGLVLIAGTKYSTNLYLARGEEAIIQEINKVEIRQLFEYTGKNWLHKRKP